MSDYETVWNGGPLLPPREGNSSLTSVTQERAPRRLVLAGHTLPERVHGGGKPKQYSEARKAAIRELWAKGLKLREIVQRTGIPAGTVYGMVAKVGRC